MDKTGLSRRQFLSTLAMTGAAGALLSAGCGPAARQVLGQALATPGNTSAGNAKGTLVKPHTIKTTTPITQVVILIKENRTYDNLFGNYPRGNGAKLVDCPEPFLNDPDHGHYSDLLGAPLGTTCGYTDAVIPNYWKLADNYTLCDNFFSEITSGSLPNHLELIAAQSPIIDMPLPPWSCPYVCFPHIATLADRANDVGATWKNYWGGLWEDFSTIPTLQNSPNNVPWQKFVADAGKGVLPNISWLKPQAGVSDHAPELLQAGENWTVEQVNAVMQGPQWDTTAIFLLWDDWGGWYDHVTPPEVQKWGDGTQFRYGFRAPCIVISPYAKQGYIYDNLSSFVSVLKFCELNFGLKSLTDADANADSLMGCFDFGQAPRKPIVMHEQVLTGALSTYKYKPYQEY